MNNVQPTELILSRHGETEENKLHIMQGQMPGHLSELGKQQAELLADRFENEALDVIVCSDLARSFDTAMAVAHRKGLQPVATPLLREMDWGVFTGKVADESDFTNLPVSAESADDLYERAGRFVAFLRQNYPGKRILAIGHGGFNRAILVWLEKKAPETLLQLPVMKNTACISFLL
ncbi:MAG: histidine phosphatase family protein [Tannerellaceae bacterium]